MSYIERHGGYTFAMTDAIFNAPLTNEPYSKVSGDFNPIHISPYFSDLVSLPDTITHGLWPSAATHQFIKTVIAHGHPDSYNVGMVLPGNKLMVMVKHIGMRDRNIVVNITTSNTGGEKVLEGTAEVAQSSTVYVFAGQGSQEPGMGMDFYTTSPAAPAVWEAANAHLLAVYGSPIIEIIKDNPKEKTIHFGSIKGQDIHQRYMELTYNAMDKDSNVKTLPLFADIDVRTPKYTFSYPKELLFTIQFAQIALVVMDKAAFEDM
jgi:fatty acid synthase subunit beta